MTHNGKLISITILLAMLWLAWPGASTMAKEIAPSPEQNSGEKINSRSGPGCFMAQIDQPPQFSDQEDKPRQRRKYIEQLRLLKLLELLDLSPDQETQFIVAFRQYRKEQRGIHRSRREIIDQLAVALKDESVDPKMIYKFINDLDKLAIERRTQEKTFIEKARTLLDARQLGKLVIFQERFEQILLEDVKAFHDRPGPSRRGHNDW